MLFPRHCTLAMDRQAVGLDKVSPAVISTTQSLFCKQSSVQMKVTGKTGIACDKSSS